MEPLEPYLRTVSAHAYQERLFRRLQHLLVAVSGGADSTAALLLLDRLGRDLGFRVTACHFDHKLRPGSADDRDAVRAMCETLGIPCVTGEGEVREMAADTGLGIEEAARKMRYQFLAFAAGKEGADAIATGHTSDDQVETVLQHIVRGSGIRGIRGMLPRGPVPGAEAQTLLRPLLPLRRADTEAVCKLFGIEPLRDPTNDDRRHSRNRVRHDVIPALAALNPNLDRAVLGLAASAREAFDEIERLAMEVQPKQRSPAGATFEAKKLKRLPGEALSLVIERESAFFKLAFEVNRTRVENLVTVLDGGSGMVAFGEVAVEVSMGQVRVGPGREPAPVMEPKALNVPGVTVAGPWRIEVATSGGEGWTPIPLLPGAMKARSIEPGDRIRAGDRSIRAKRWFESARVPRWQREGAVVIAVGNEILAIAGMEVPGATPADDSLWLKVTPLPSR